jgi:hypothetical protein
MVIERTFDVLKWRFPRLKYVDMQDIEKIVKVVLSCCVSHEFCLQHADDCVEFIEDGREDEVNNFEEFCPEIMLQEKKGIASQDCCERQIMRKETQP